MKSRKHILVLSFFSCLFAVGCTHEKRVSATEKQYRKSYEEAQGRATTAAVATESGATDFTEIQFREGSSSLSDEAKKSLRSMLTEPRFDDRVEEVIVLSWADQNYPSKEVSKLSKEQRNLADQRNDNVKEYLKSMRDLDVKTFNMAERPSSFSKLFNTADSELKNSMLHAGLSTTADKDDYASKASHSVILIKTRE